MCCCPKSKLLVSLSTSSVPNRILLNWDLERTHTRGVGTTIHAWLKLVIDRMPEPLVNMGSLPGESADRVLCGVVPPLPTSLRSQSLYAQEARIPCEKKNKLKKKPKPKTKTIVANCICSWLRFWRTWKYIFTFVLTNSKLLLFYQPKSNSLQRNPREDAVPAPAVRVPGQWLMVVVAQVPRI